VVDWVFNDQPQIPTDLHRYLKTGFDLRPLFFTDDLWSIGFLTINHRFSPIFTDI